MHDLPLAVIMGALGSLAGLAAAWGAFRQRIEHLAAQIAELRETDRKQAEQLGKLAERAAVADERITRMGADGTGRHPPFLTRDRSGP